MRIAPIIICIWRVDRSSGETGSLGATWDGEDMSQEARARDDCKYLKGDPVGNCSPYPTFEFKYLNSLSAI